MNKEPIIKKEKEKMIQIPMTFKNEKNQNVHVIWEESKREGDVVTLIPRRVN